MCVCTCVRACVCVCIIQVAAPPPHHPGCCSQGCGHWPASPPPPRIIQVAALKTACRDLGLSPLGNRYELSERVLEGVARARGQIMIGKDDSPSEMRVGRGGGGGMCFVFPVIFLKDILCVPVNVF